MSLRPKLDTTGEFPSGETYADFTGFKKVIHDTRSDLFTRHLIRQLLTYTTGRGDGFRIRQIFEIGLHKRAHAGISSAMVSSAFAGCRKTCC
ncbi:MAG: DUF1585 domain-containing protein [Prosthecobacter sp.]